MQREKKLEKLIINEEILTLLNIDKSENIEQYNVEIYSAIKENISVDDLIQDIYKQILSLRIDVMDKAKGIHSSINKLSNGACVWIRHYNADKKLDIEINTSDFNYLRIFYTYVISALLISKLYDFASKEIIQTIQNIKVIITKDFFNYIDENKNLLLEELIQKSKGQLVSALACFSELYTQKEFDDMLDISKNWVALEQNSVSVLTCLESPSVLQGKKILILDEPCTKLTTEQLNQLNNIDDNFVNADWYEKLSDLEKKLFMHYKKNIISQSCTIPSRTRDTLTPLKNAYKQSVLRENEDGKFIEINSYYHSATTAYLNRNNTKEANNLTEENLLQQKLNANTDANLMICLNSAAVDYVLETMRLFSWNKPPKGEDYDILNLTQKAAMNLKAKSIFYSKICLNGFRGLEWHDYSGIDSIIEIIKNNISNFNNTDSINSINKHIKEIDKIKSQYNLMHFSDVKELDIIFHLSKIIFLNNQLAPSENITNISLWFGCASGENRTGITSYHLAGMTAISHLLLFASVDEKAVFTLLTDSEHFNIMTGFQGSTLGTEGIRAKSSSSTQDKHNTTKLVTRHSDLKEIKTITLDAPSHQKQKTSNWSIGNYFWWGTKKTDDSKQEPPMQNASNLNK